MNQESTRNMSEFEEYTAELTSRISQLEAIVLKLASTLENKDERVGARDANQTEGTLCREHLEGFYKIIKDRLSEMDKKIDWRLARIDSRIRTVRDTILNWDWTVRKPYKLPFGLIDRYIQSLAVHQALQV
jgi:U3 small nucleolar ribonucleoprotein component